MAIEYSTHWFEHRLSELWSDMQALQNAIEREQDWEAILSARDLAAGARALVRFLTKSDQRLEVLGW